MLCEFYVQWRPVLKIAQAAVGPTRGWEPLSSGWALDQFVIALISVLKRVISKSVIYFFCYIWLSGKTLSLLIDW